MRAAGDVRRAFQAVADELRQRGWARWAPYARSQSEGRGATPLGSRERLLGNDHGRIPTSIREAYEASL